MTDSQSYGAGWIVLALFGAGAAWVATFLFWRVICTSPSSSSLVSLRFFNLCGTNFYVVGHTIMDAFVCSCLFFVLCSLVSSSSFSSSHCDYFFVFFFICSSVMIFCIFLVIPKLFRSRPSPMIALANLFCFLLFMASTSIWGAFFRFYSRATFIAFRLVWLNFGCLATTKPLATRVCLDSSSILLKTWYTPRS